MASLGLNSKRRSRVIRRADRKRRSRKKISQACPPAIPSQACPPAIPSQACRRRNRGYPPRSQRSRLYRRTNQRIQRSISLRNVFGELVDNQVKSGQAENACAPACVYRELPRYTQLGHEKRTLRSLSISLVICDELSESHRVVRGRPATKR